jgi:ketol-acid reductoisomerase
MANIVYEKDANLDNLKGKKVAIIGFGSQGHAHAQNLHDSGVDVVVGLRDGSISVEKAKAAGLAVDSVAGATASADVVMILAPDQYQRTIWAEEIEPNLKPEAAIAFAHGFNIRYGYIKPAANHDIFMVAPKGPGHTVRREFLAGRGVPVVWAVEQDATGNAKDIALAYAMGLGALRAGGIETTFKEETESDLFGEQAVLCGGVSSMIQKGFEVLVENGVQPEIAYFEVCHELKLIVDLIVEGGLSKQRWSVSDTAEYGDYISGPFVIDGTVKARMQTVFDRIQNGEFADRFIKDQDNGGEEFKKLRAEQAGHKIEEVGKNLRKMYKWQENTDTDYVEGDAGRH